MVVVFEALLGGIRERARALATKTIVITFEPHPLEVLEPRRAPRRLTTPAQKLALLEETGVDAVARGPRTGRNSRAPMPRVPV